MCEQDGADCVAPINEVLDTVTFDSVYYTLDWHPENHVSFIENVSLRKLHPSSKVPILETAPDWLLLHTWPNQEQVTQVRPESCVVLELWGSLCYWKMANR